MHLSSFSITVIDFGFFFANSIVKLPAPGPTSKMSEQLSTSAAATILLIIFFSKRKCCPSDFFENKLC